LNQTAKKANENMGRSVPFNRSYWVVPDKFLAGYYPGSENKDKAYKKLKGLLDHGIRNIINLMEPDEINWNRKHFFPYEEQMKSIDESMGVDVTFERIPIKDMRTSSRIEMIQTLDRIDESIEHGRPVYIHCWGGRGRTGTVVGCYLARHGYASGQKVIEFIKDLRRNTEDHNQASPETSGQIDMVLSWVEGE
jgi:protein tyrosine/serine phosphatase